MSKLAEAIPSTENTAAFQAEHVRTHRRWAATVLALYGIIVSVGIMATLAHKSWIVDVRPPAMQVATQSPIR
jgi:membrane protein YdbS with pleckstrin-like domain